MTQLKPEDPTVEQRVAVLRAIRDEFGSDFSESDGWSDDRIRNYLADSIVMFVWSTGVGRIFPRLWRDERENERMLLATRAGEGSVDEVRAMLDRDPTLLEAPFEELSPLHAAIAANRLDVVRELTARGAELNERVVNALAHAVEEQPGNLAMARVLIEAGARFNGEADGLAVAFSSSGDLEYLEFVAQRGLQGVDAEAMGRELKGVFNSYDERTLANGKPLVLARALATLLVGAELSTIND